MSRRQRRTKTDTANASAPNDPPEQEDVRSHEARASNAEEFHQDGEDALNDSNLTEAGVLVAVTSNRPDTVPAKRRRKAAMAALTHVQQRLRSYDWAYFGVDASVIDGYCTQLEHFREKLEAVAPKTPGRKLGFEPGDAVTLKPSVLKSYVRDFGADACGTMMFMGVQGLRGRVELEDGTVVFPKLVEIVPLRDNSSETSDA